MFFHAAKHANMRVMFPATKHANMCVFLHAAMNANIRVILHAAKNANMRVIFLAAKSAKMQRRHTPHPPGATTINNGQQPRWLNGSPRLSNGPFGKRIAGRSV